MFEKTSYIIVCSVLFMEYGINRAFKCVLWSSLPTVMMMTMLVMIIDDADDAQLGQPGKGIIITQH